MTPTLALAIAAAVALHVVTLLACAYLVRQAERDMQRLLALPPLRVDVALALALLASARREAMPHTLLRLRLNDAIRALGGAVEDMAEDAAK